jgi:hypothetical protein
MRLKIGLADVVICCALSFLFLAFAAGLYLSLILL